MAPSAQAPRSLLSKSILEAPANGVTSDLRQHMFNITDSFAGIESYGKAILNNLRVTELSLLQKEEEIGKLEAKMVFETRVVDSE